MKNLILVTFILYYSCLNGQEIVFGDSTFVEKVKEKTSSIFGNKDKSYFFLTNRQLLKEKTYGISITAYSKQGIINRVIGISYTEKGQLSTEWYFFDNKLIYVYRTFEYFNEVDNEEIWKNFKGNWGWESRYYLSDEQLKYHKHKGRHLKSQKIKESEILKDGEIILNYITNRIKEK